MNTVTGTDTTHLSIEPRETPACHAMTCFGRADELTAREVCHSADITSLVEG